MPGNATSGAHPSLRVERRISARDSKPGEAITSRSDEDRSSTDEDLPTEPIRILIAEDHLVVREAMRLMLETCSEVSVVGEAESGELALDLARELEPHLVLMDIRMQGMDGVAATRMITQECPGVSVLILTGYGGDEYLMDAIEAGAKGYLLKDASRDEVINAIRIVARGESLVSPSLLRRLLDEFSRRKEKPAHAYEELTPREMEVLVALAGGLSNAEIARQLTISEKTVRTHLGNIFGKLQVEGRIQAILYAIREGWVAV